MTWFLDTEHPVATESYDYIDSKIQELDLSYNPAFNAKLYQICQGPLTVLDVGCGAGNFVKTVIADGREAVGLEGDSHHLDHKYDGWSAVPSNLFTCDVAYRFTLHQGDHVPYCFDVVTAWEFVEHIQESDLPMVWNNIRRHLRVGGLFIMTTPSDIRHHPRRGLDHHRTRRDEAWWTATIMQHGFLRLYEIEEFFGEDWVRRSGVHQVYAKLDERAMGQ